MNASVEPVRRSIQDCRRRVSGANSDQQVVAEHRRRQHQRQREHASIAGFAANRRQASARPTSTASGSSTSAVTQRELERENERRAIHGRLIPQSAGSA